MPHNEALAERVRAVLKGQRGLEERKMFGGVCFLLRGNMCCGVANDDLVARVGPDYQPKALARAHVRPMDFTGKPLKGFVYVGEPGLRTKKSLEAWVGHCLDFARELPAKAKKTAAKKAPTEKAKAKKTKGAGAKRPRTART